MPGIFGATGLCKHDVTAFDNEVYKIVKEKASDEQEFAQVMGVFMVEGTLVKEGHGIGGSQ